MDTWTVIGWAWLIAITFFNLGAVAFFAAAFLYIKSKE